jgi:hypothetical protein
VGTCSVSFSLIHRAGRPALIIPVLLILILAGGFALRAQRCGNGLPYVYHPDEPRTVSTALNMMKTGDFNPHFFHYGTLMTYVHLGVDVLHFFQLMGKPESAPAHLRSLDDIRFSEDYRWFLAPASFYRVNRLVVALMGAASIALVYFITRGFAGPWGALVAAAILALSEPHITHSAYVTNDVPSAFFILAAMAFCLLFLDRTHPGFLLSAALCTGFAAACKYNAALSAILPVATLAFSTVVTRRAAPLWLWPAVLLLPGIAFFIGTPYALFDLPTFLNQAGWEVTHYKVKGHGRHTVAPGLPHLLLQIQYLVQAMGIVATLLAVAGCIYQARTARWWLFLLFPILYAAFLSSTIISFPRNWLVFHLFMAIAAGCGAAGVVRLITAAATRTARSPRLPLSIAAAALVILFGTGFARAAAQGAQIAARVDTRSEAIELIARLATEQGWKVIGVAEELRVHPQDLNRLPIPYIVMPLADLLCQDFPAIITSPNYVSSATAGKYKIQARQLNRLQSGATPLLNHGGRAGMRIDAENASPGVVVLADWKRPRNCADGNS